MRQTVWVGEVLREWGMAIFPGLRRGWGIMCFLVVSTNQIGWASVGLEVSEIRRFLDVEVASFFSALDAICLRRAEDALRVLWVSVYIEQLLIGLNIPGIYLADKATQHWL